MVPVGRPSAFILWGLSSSSMAAGGAACQPMPRNECKSDIPDGSLSLVSIITSVISTIISSAVRIIISPVAPVHQQSTFARWSSLTSPCPYRRTYPYRRRTVACHLCPFRTHRHHLESRVHHLFDQRRHFTTRTKLQPGLLSPLY